MEAFALYHPNSDHARPIETFSQDFERQTGHGMQLLSLESSEGSRKASLYGVSSYPAILVVRESGEMVKAWEGTALPTINEVNSYIL